MIELVELSRAERCETCKFWDTMGEELDAGYCRLFPPVANVAQICYGMLIKVDQIGLSGWSHPETGHNDWCGQWQPATVAPAAPETA